jgi:leader peptidase (prepilin peptidase)/N-methyltransferase
VPQPFLYLYAALFGLIFGSFLNVVIHRLPLGLSLVKPRSRCPYCDGEIRVLDNIPVLSFLVLRGRCSRCGAPISWRYPLIELTTALLFVACAARFGFTIEAGVGAIFCMLMLVLAMIDADHFILPDKITLPGIILGLALQPWIPRTTLIDAVVGTLIGAGGLILTINFWYWIREEEGMGMGDVNMLAMVGAFLGWEGVAITLFISALAGAVAGLALVLRGKLNLRSKLPFGTFLALGGVVALFWGEAIAAHYREILLL